MHELEKRIAAFLLRPLVVLRKRKLYAVMVAWQGQAEERHHKRQLLERVGRHWRNQKLAGAWNTW